MNCNANANFSVPNKPSLGILIPTKILLTLTPKIDAKMEVDVWKLNLALASCFQLRMQRGKIDGSNSTVI